MAIKVAAPEEAKQVDAKKIEAKTLSFKELLLKCLTLIQSGSVTHDTRISSRVFRIAVALRRQFDQVEFMECVNTLLSEKPEIIGSLIFALLNKFATLNPTVQSQSDVDMRTSTGVDTDVCMEYPKSNNTDIKQEQNANQSTVGDGVQEEKTLSYKDFQKEESIEEIKMFLIILTLMKAIDYNCATDGLDLSSQIIQELSTILPLQKYDDILVSKAIFYLFRMWELSGKLSNIMEFLMRMHRTAVIHHYKMCQAVSLNSILRIFIQSSQYEQATKFLEKTTYPQDLRSNAQQARYLYYLGRILAVRLDYFRAHSHVTDALRKAPSASSCAGRGFRLAATKLNVILQLLLGEIPERRIFVNNDLAADLISYSQIIQSVHSGDLLLFKRVMEKNQALFAKDGNFILVQRLHHNVIRAGLRKTAKSYSCILLSDVAVKLGLDSSDDAECIISKTIADGVIDATIDSETKTLCTKATAQVRTLKEIQEILNAKIGLCLQLYNDAVKAIQYPEPLKETSVEEAEARRKEYQKQVGKDLSEIPDDAELI